MTATETEQFADYMAELERDQKQGVFRRTVGFSLEGDGRTLETRIVPYNVSAEVADPPNWQPYREMFLPGAFDEQVNAVARAGRKVNIYLNFEHQQGLDGVVGHSINLADREDALHGTFRVLDHPDGDKALQLINEGVLTGLSIEFREPKKRKAWRLVDGVKQRFSAHIDKVSLCRFPAYQQAQVLAVRTEPVELPGGVPWPAELAERLQRYYERFDTPPPESLRAPAEDSQ